MEQDFRKYLLEIRGMKNTTSTNEYIRTMPKVKDWFVNNGICDSNLNIWDLNLDITNIQLKLNGELKQKWKNAAKKTKEGDFGFMMATWNRWVEFKKYRNSDQWKNPNDNKFDLQTGNIDLSMVMEFKLDSALSSLIFSNLYITRYLSSLLTKPFIILTGLSGSGKTKLAQAFAMWISESKEQYSIVPVGADWTNREPLLGYPNSLKPEHYVKPDTGVLDILLRAHENFLANKKNLAKCKPYFLILDEMNLSHVERYFADFLSTMESGDELKLYSGCNRFSELDSNDKPILNSIIPEKIALPKNLFIIGTVNIDESTYMFSPKVLDRANTIESRISYDEMENYFKTAKPLEMDAIVSKGKEQAPYFMQLASGETVTINHSAHNHAFISFFKTLQVAGAEFGYRTANEMIKLVTYLQHFGVSANNAYDIAIMQKLLPKLHGSRSKLNKVLPALIELCEGKYIISLEKLERMKKNSDENGFASYAEA
jgi:5-methylcytosine-specific restriction protein B